MQPTSNSERSNTDDLSPEQRERIYVVIPALNEASSIGRVLADLPTAVTVYVVDNGSTDATAQIAARGGAKVIMEPQRGYGKACLTGIAAVNAAVDAAAQAPSDVTLVFMDGDYSDHPDELAELARPILDDESDFVVGSRATGKREAGAMPFQAIFGNQLACSLMRLFWGARFTDLGPFRAIRLSKLNQLGMRDENFGWTIEMQIKAVQQNLRIREIPVSYRQRIGVSKISGTISGTIRAGYKILYTLFMLRFRA